MFEDEFPKDLWQYFPLSFQERLEYECGGNWCTILSLRESEWKERLQISKMLAGQARKSAT